MPLIVDTYNVLHATGILPPDMAGIDVDGLIELLQASRYKREKTTLVCDGRAQPAKERPAGKAGGAVTVKYSGPGKQADDLIGQLVRASSAPRRLTVVSSDHAVQRAARRRRCKTLSAHEFLHQLVNDARLDQASPGEASAKPPSSSMTQDQIDRWISVFNLDAKTVNLPARAAAEPEPIAQKNPADKSSKATRRAETDPQPRHLATGEIVPPSIIEQAEQLWEKEQRGNDKPREAV